MMMNIEIKTQDTTYGPITQVFVDGNKIDRVTGIDFQHHVDGLPELIIKTCGYPNISASGCFTRLRFDVGTCEDAMKVIRNNLMHEKVFYDAFKASIKSVLIEVPANSGFDCVAEKILDRIIGEESNG